MSMPRPKFPAVSVLQSVEKDHIQLRSISQFARSRAVGNLKREYWSGSKSPPSTDDVGSRKVKKFKIASDRTTRFSDD